MKKLATAALSAHTCPSSSGRLGQEGKLTPYCQVVDYLLMTNTTDDTIFEADVEATNFKQSKCLNAVEYPQTLSTKALCFGPMYDEYRLKGTFCEGFKRGIRQCVRTYWSKNIGALL